MNLLDRTSFKNAKCTSVRYVRQHSFFILINIPGKKKRVGRRVFTRRATRTNAFLCVVRRVYSRGDAIN